MKSRPLTGWSPRSCRGSRTRRLWGRGWRAPPGARPRSWSGTATRTPRARASPSLIAKYNQEHPDVEVTQLVSSSDLVLQKILTAVRGGTPPDVAYMFGSWAPNIAKIPQVVDMSRYVKQAGLELGRLLCG